MKYLYKKILREIAQMFVMAREKKELILKKKNYAVLLLNIMVLAMINVHQKQK